MKQLHALTSLRAFLALWVVTRHLFHPFWNGVFFDIGTRVSLFSKGYLGVDGFFILSGFILAYNYANGAPLDYRKFLGARFARIYPVHVVCLVAAAAVIFFKQFHLHKEIIGTAANTYTSLLANFVLLNSWSFETMTGWNDVAWSVSAEWFAYVFFPVFVFLAPRRNRFAIGSAMVLPVVALALVEWRSRYGLSMPGGLARLIPEFYTGVLLFRLRQAGMFAKLSRLSGTIAVCIVVLGVSMKIDTVSVIGLGLLIFALSCETDYLARPLRATWLIYLGEISYCMYMVQRFPMEAFSLARKSSNTVAGLPTPIQMVIYATILLLCAAALHHVVENPSRRALKNFFNRFEHRPLRHPELSADAQNSGAA
ncbi:acyltransferase [Paraburkholderia aspalathi]|uniref:acyltransferase family protein n=1 Tax=Paraburkholderia aspalathi TaxID=1324617 RepID=UPI0038BACCFA